MRVNEQIVVLDESLEAFGNRSEIVRILVLAMTTAGDGASAVEIILSQKLVVRFALF